MSTLTYGKTLVETKSPIWGMPCVCRYAVYLSDHSENRYCCQKLRLQVQEWLNAQKQNNFKISIGIVGIGAVIAVVVLTTPIVSIIVIYIYCDL
jgi:Ca2+/H+ antiporter